MTVRMITCDELATNYEDMCLLQKYYWDLEKSATPTALLLPWILSPAKKKKSAATKALYTILKNYIDKLFCWERGMRNIGLLVEPLHKRLSAIPIAAWEDDMPIVDLVRCEIIHITQNQTLLRRNVSDDMEFCGQKIAKGEFIVYSIYDSHMNPDFYENPEMFNPDHYRPWREEDKKSTFAYVGWGAGRYPCPGMKVAKLEMKAILVLFLAI
ncbi:cytochrome P450 [Cyathus striatus]|nr:cytochrome P450 [Cyathus striatus]